MLLRTALALLVASVSPAIATTVDKPLPAPRPLIVEPGCNIASMTQTGDVTIDWACADLEAARGSAFAKLLKAVRDGTARAK